MLKRITTAVLAAVVGTATLVAGPAAHADTAPSISHIDVSPSPVVVTGWAGTTATFAFVTTNPAQVSASIAPSGGSAKPLTLAPPQVGIPESTRWTATEKFGRSAPAGEWTLRIKAVNGSAVKEESRTFTVRQVWDTGIAGFGASPEPVRRGETLSLSGRLLADGLHGRRGLPDQKVYIEFKPAGGSHYTRVGYDYTNWRGEFSTGVRAWSTGWWRAEFAGSDTAGPSVSDTDQVDVVAPRPRPRHSTRFVSFDATPEPVKYGKYLSFRGALQVWDAGWEGYGNRRVTLWFKGSGGHWTYVKTTWTNSTGKLWTKTKAVRSGSWKFVFDGDGHAKGSSSKADSVRVKR
ncbi:hypothetical protein JOL79_18205 [Microbispora sp. RL4-1S]|uniref:P/Homo B domain-containing protein n=1 Tax=Microbispora oryzae TaxID=2806554 RepID=A0A940WKV3_9ACTN|nr:hypothetical protein [Microbispora oryzae]MBP2705752.1 hypothetical protein [Microbispora oryzae]